MTYYRKVPSHYMDGPLLTYDQCGHTSMAFTWRQFHMERSWCDWLIFYRASHIQVNNTPSTALSTSCTTIDPSHKSHNASVPHPTMQHFVTEMCKCVHISVTKCCIVGYLPDALWDLWDGSICQWSLCINSFRSINQPVTRHAAKRLHGESGILD